MEQPPKYVTPLTSEERLAFLERWAEEQKYVRPGEGGTLPGGGRGMAALAFGGPMRSYGKEPQYTAPIGPPSYDLAMRQNADGSSQKTKKEGKKGAWRGLFKKRENDKEGKGGEEEEMRTSHLRSNN
jgi:hypothetical protein